MRLRRRHRAPGPPADRLLRRPDPLPTAPPPVLLLVRSEAVARGGVLGRVDQRDPLHAGHRRRAVQDTVPQGEPEEIDVRRGDDSSRVDLVRRWDVWASRTNLHHRQC